MIEFDIFFLIFSAPNVWSHWGHRCKGYDLQHNEQVINHFILFMMYGASLRARKYVRMWMFNIIFKEKNASLYSFFLPNT